jgi:ParB/RepB/Spo0J family partition protein
MKIKLSDIKPSPLAIRKTWLEEGLEELAQSIKEHGLIVPIKVRHSNGKYEIIYGHRRVKAMRRAGITETEAIVDEVDDTQVLIQSLIENVQREEMPPIDIAKALFAIQEETGWSQKEMGRRGIMGESSIQHYMALLAESPEIQKMIVKAKDQGSTPEGTVTEHLVRLVRHSGLPQSEREAVIKKAAEERLTAEQTRRVADTVKAAKSEERKKYLLETPYSPLKFEPELEKELPAKHLEADRSSEIDWNLQPDAGRILEKLSMWEKEDIPNMRASKELDKLAPEVGQFIARRIKRVESALTSWRWELEDRYGGR